MRRLVFLAVMLVLLGGVVALGATAVAQHGDISDPTPDFCGEHPDVCSDPTPDFSEIGVLVGDDDYAGESVFGEGAAVALLAAGVLPGDPPQALALQHVRLAPGARIVTPPGDPRVTLIFVARGTLTVRNTVDATVRRGAAAATPGAREAVPAETEFTMGAGDSSLNPAGSGGELRNDGTEEVSLLVSLIAPIAAGTATPRAGTPVP